MKLFLVSLALACVLSATSANAITYVTVEETSVTPFETMQVNIMNPIGGGVFYSGGVYAGLNNLLVDGVPATGFCIDPFHFSKIGPVDHYQIVDLTAAPKSANMTAGQAALIRALWTLNYSSIGTSNASAAALQVAIWEVVAGTRFNLGASQSDFGAVDLRSAAADYLTHNGPLTNLVGLTGSGQDYVIAAPTSVPDTGATGLLLFFAFGALAFSRQLQSGARYATAKVRVQ